MVPPKMSRLGGFYFCRMVSRILLWIRKQTHDTILIYNNRWHARIAKVVLICRKYCSVTFALGGYSTTRTELAGAGGGGAVSCCVWQSVVKCFFVTRQYT